MKLNTDTDNKKTFACCGLMFLIGAIFMIAFMSTPQLMDTNKTINIYDVNITIPEQSNAEITNTKTNLGYTYAYDDPNTENLTIYVSDDPAPEVEPGINYNSLLKCYEGKTFIRGKSVVVYCDSMDVLERVLWSAR